MPFTNQRGSGAIAQYREANPVGYILAMVAILPRDLSFDVGGLQLVHIVFSGFDEHRQQQSNGVLLIPE
jgi:hypothetical protein